MSGFITTKTVIENRELITELWGEAAYAAAMTTTAKTWLEFLTINGIL